MMNLDDQRRVFWLLKKNSSYTSWAAFGKAFQRFVDAWEYAVKSDVNANEFTIGALKGFWKACEAFDKGLLLLKQGEQHIFRQRGCWIISDQLQNAAKLMDTEEYEHGWMKNKDEVFDAFNSLEKYHNAFIVTESENHENPAKLGKENVFLARHWPPRIDYSQFNFPSDLPEVPSVTKLTISTGDSVPCSGVWEPEWKIVDGKPQGFYSGLINLVGGTATKENRGCMNYLLVDTVAPTYKDTETGPAIPVRWRLIWEDTRYRDGVIPEEEQDYLREVHESAPQAQGLPDSHLTRCPADQPCPRAGFWSTLAKEGSRRYFEQGESMPNFPDSSYGATIWMWDLNQEK